MLSSLILEAGAIGLTKRMHKIVGSVSMSAKAVG